MPSKVCLILLITFARIQVFWNSIPRNSRVIALFLFKFNAKWHFNFLAVTNYKVSSIIICILLIGITFEIKRKDKWHWKMRRQLPQEGKWTALSKRKEPNHKQKMQILFKFSPIHSDTSADSFCFTCSGIGFC